MIEGPAGQALFKLAIFNMLEDKTSSTARDKKIAASLKYQVLCDDTAIIGVCSQENKATGEVEESNIKFKTQDMENFLNAKRQEAERQERLRLDAERREKERQEYEARRA